MKKLDKKFIPKNMYLKKATICSILVISLLSSLMVSARLIDDQQNETLLLEEQVSTLEVKSMSLNSVNHLVPSNLKTEQPKAADYLTADAAPATDNTAAVPAAEETPVEETPTAETTAENTAEAEIPAEAQPAAEQVAPEAAPSVPQETAIESKTIYLTDTCNIRSLPSTESEVLRTLASGTALTATATTDNGFYKLDDGSYVTGEYITEEAPAEFTWNEEAASMTMYLIESCHHREQPTTDSASLGVIRSGSAVNVVATTDQGFYKLDDNSYISAQFLTDTAPVAAVTQQNTTTQTVVHDGTIRGILNAAPLNPRSTGFANVDAKIQEVFNQIGIDQMTDTYSKVKAIYDYLNITTEYGKNVYPSAGY